MAICPSYIGARRLRATRLDNCGRPVYGECSQVVSDGFVSIEFSPEIEEGEDYTQRNANGDLCVSERGQDALQWINVSIEFCRVDAELWTIMNPTWKTVTNAQGEVTGFRIGEKFSDSQGFALEVWPKASAQSSLCDDDAPDEADPNGYFLLPYVLGTAPESWTLEDGVATFTLNGRTKGGSLWGRGPYNITHDAQGNPTPLLRPIDSGAESGDPDHFHADIVTLTPPQPRCGCQPLEPMAPGAQDGEITVDEEQPNRACFTVSGSPGRRVTIDWGDGSDEVRSRVGREECHLYTETGAYTVTVTDIDDAEKTNSYEVEITEIPQLPDPTIEVVPTSGLAPLGVDLTVNNHGNGDVTIDWGDGSEPQTEPGGDDGDERTYPHEFTGTGDYEITVTADADDRAAATATVTVTDPTPVISAPDTAEATHSFDITVDNHDQGPVDIDWGDDTEGDTNPGDAEVVTSHTYTEPGTYTITATSQANRDHVGQHEIEVTPAGGATPAAPTNARVNGDDPDGPTADSIPITWDWDQGDGPAVTGFEVRWRTSDTGDGAGDWSTPDAVEDPEARTYTITALEPDTSYDFAVRAMGENGNSAWSDPATASTAGETAPAPAVPGQPTVADGEEPTADSIPITWDWDQGDGPAATGFEVRHRTAPEEGEPGQWSDPAAVDGGADARSHTITGLEPGTRYEFAVRATGEEANSAWSDPAAATTAPEAMSTRTTRNRRRP